MGTSGGGGGASTHLRQNVSGLKYFLLGGKWRSKYSGRDKGQAHASVGYVMEVRRRDCGRQASKKGVSRKNAEKSQSIPTKNAMGKRPGGVLPWRGS